MGNYADPAATRHVVLGPCRCPKKDGARPHAEDTADVVTAFGYGELAEIYQATRALGKERGYLVAILLGVKRWNLVLPDGTARPIDALQVARLRKADIDRFLADDVLGDAFEEDDELPNPSGDPSPDGSPASSSPTPTTPEPPSSTST